MGSFDTIARCPDCGMNARITYYHMGSFDVECPVCNFYCHKIVRGLFTYEDSDLDGNVYPYDPAADCDIDGFARVIRHTDKDVDNLVVHVREDQNTYNGVKITQDENGDYWAINKFEDNENRIPLVNVPHEYYDLCEDAVKAQCRYEEIYGEDPLAEETFKKILCDMVGFKFSEEAEKLNISVLEYKNRRYGEPEESFKYKEGKVKIIVDKVDKYAELSKHCLDKCNSLKCECHNLKGKIEDMNLNMDLDDIVLGIIDLMDAIEKLNKYR